MNKDEALKMAIEALSQDEGWFEPEAAIKACKEALAQPAQEPVGHLYINEDKTFGASIDKSAKDLPQGTHKLYTHPAPAWQGLSDDEIRYHAAFNFAIKLNEVNDADIDFARAIEQALKEKNI